MNTINKVQFLLTKCMYAVFKTSTCTSVIPWIIAVDSLAHSLHNQVTYHMQKYLTLQNKYNNSPCSVMTKLPYTALTYSMILHLPYANTCYDKLIIYYTQQLQQLTTTYPTILQEWRVIMQLDTLYTVATQTVWALFGALWLVLNAMIKMLQLHHPPIFLIISLTRTLLKWPYQYISIFQNSTPGLLFSSFSNKL